MRAFHFCLIFYFAHIHVVKTNVWHVWAINSPHQINWIPMVGGGGSNWYQNGLLCRSCLQTPYTRTGYRQWTGQQKCFKTDFCTSLGSAPEYCRPIWYFVFPAGWEFNVIPQVKLNSGELVLIAKLFGFTRVHGDWCVILNVHVYLEEYFHTVFNGY